MTKPLAKMFHNDLNVDPMVTSGMGCLASVLEIATCEENAVLDRSGEEMLTCPLEFGSECFDAMREVMSLTGVLGDNNPNNGMQGNHNDNSQTGVFNDANSVKPAAGELFGR